MREGVLWPLFLATVSVAVFGIVGALLVQEPVTLLRSLGRLPYVGSETTECLGRRLQTGGSGRRTLGPHRNDRRPAVSNRRSSIDRPVQRPGFDGCDDVRSSRSWPGAALDVIADEEVKWTKGEQDAQPVRRRRRGESLHPKSR